MVLARSVEEEEALALLLLQVAVALKVLQVFSRVRYAAGVGFFKVLVRNVEREGTSAVLLLQVPVVTPQFQVRFDIRLTDGITIFSSWRAVMDDLKPCIITVKSLLQTKNLQIPDYQRPYKWTENNINQLIDDILLHKEKPAYRLGTLVIHNEGGNLNIVDGQQRTITLALLAYAITQAREEELRKIFIRGENIGNYNPDLLKLRFSNDITKANIQNNYKTIQRRINENQFDESVISFLFNKCELVRVTLTDISEAFQFFDSQNARGKDLEPHDLLKAFHLREMNNSSTVEERIKTVEKWEAMDTEKLSKLFSLYLYRIRNWSKGYSARYFNKNDVDVFKGISPDIKEDYPFEKIFRIANYYTEDYNNSVHRKINHNEFDYPFQIDQTLINGKHFFEMIAYYDKMIDDIEIMNDNKILKTIRSYKGSYRTGDKYIRNLFYCGLVYFVDKFGYKDLSRAVDKIFIWAYSLRLQMQAVQLASMDNYALDNVHLFKKIREAIKPNEILSLKLTTLRENKSSKTEEIEKIFKEMMYL